MILSPLQAALLYSLSPKLCRFHFSWHKVITTHVDIQNGTLKRLTIYNRGVVIYFQRSSKASYTKLLVLRVRNIYSYIADEYILLHPNLISIDY
jgi:hypothetical protein